MRLRELERGCLRVAEKRLDHRTDSDLACRVRKPCGVRKLSRPGLRTPRALGIVLGEREFGGQPPWLG